MNNLIQLTTTQLIKELIRRKLITVSSRGINITKEFMDELRKDDYWEKQLTPNCRECGSFLLSGDLCYECSEKLKQEKDHV